MSEDAREWGLVLVSGVCMDVDVEEVFTCLVEV